MIDLNTVAKAEGLSPGQLAARLVNEYTFTKTSNVLTFRPRDIAASRADSEAKHPSRQSTRAERIQRVLAELEANSHTDVNPTPGD